MASVEFKKGIQETDKDRDKLSNELLYQCFSPFTTTQHPNQGLPARDANECFVAWLESSQTKIFSWMKRVDSKKGIKGTDMHRGKPSNSLL